MIIFTDQTKANTSCDDIAKCITKNALDLIGSKYKAGTLEGKGPETLKYFSDKFDCVTFVEYVLALSFSQTNIYGKNDGFDFFLQNLRYRDGKLNGYASRLHYFTEWILQNSASGYLKDVTGEIGGVPYIKNMNYMSSHTDRYPGLEDSAQINVVKMAEKRISSFPWMYIPKKDIRKCESMIRSGDIIGITTKISGLDIVHTGFALRLKGDLFLLHASEKDGLVTVTSKPLSEYIKSNNNQSGIIVLRCNKNH